MGPDVGITGVGFPVHSSCEDTPPNEVSDSANMGNKFTP